MIYCQYSFENIFNMKGEIRIGVLLMLDGLLAIVILSMDPCYLGQEQ